MRPAQGDVAGGGQAEAVIGEDHKILDERLSKSDQAEFSRADNPDEIRKDDERQYVIDALQSGEGENVG